MISFPFSHSPQSKSRGFSLIELLIVVAIMGGLMTVTMMSLPTLQANGATNQAVAEVSGLLEQARQYAISRNTYVWVAFYPDTAATSGDELTVAVLASLDGTDSNPWGNYGSVPSADIELIGRIKTFRQIKLCEAAAFGPSDVESLPTNVQVTQQANSIANKTMFKIKVPSTQQVADFTRIIQFTPAGEARNSSSPINLVEFALEPKRGNSSGDDKKAVVLRVNGLTGQTLVYRR